MAPPELVWLKFISCLDVGEESARWVYPVTFHYKSDNQNAPQFGLIAEEVAKVNPDLVVRDENGEIYTVRYEVVNAMLLNEFLKEHRQVEAQKAGLAEMKSVLSKQEELIAKQQKQIETLIATVQKVSDQVALSKPAPQLVANP
jgi:trimeric autotransporter adhesin